MSNDPFEFERSPGLVWVCDTAHSSRFLNEDSSIVALEQFLPRLYWASLQAVAAAKGSFIKWTGDGFLAWFPTDIERTIGSEARRIFEAARHLTLLVNVTLFGVESKDKIRLRHAVAYEPDALVLRRQESDLHVTTDLIGRSIVQAFRMACIACPFPSIVTQACIAGAYAKERNRIVSFGKRRISADERLKYFKDETYGIESIYATTRQSRNAPSLQSAANTPRKALGLLEDSQEPDTVATRFARRMQRGPVWAKLADSDLFRFMNAKVAGTLKSLLPVLPEQAKGKRRNERLESIG